MSNRGKSRSTIKSIHGRDRGLVVNEEILPIGQVSIGQRRPLVNGVFGAPIIRPQRRLRIS